MGGSLLQQWIDEVNGRMSLDPKTKYQYITDAEKMLETADPLYGPGYETVLNGMTKLIKNRMQPRKP